MENRTERRQPALKEPRKHLHKYLSALVIKLIAEKIGS